MSKSYVNKGDGIHKVFKLHLCNEISEANSIERIRGDARLQESGKENIGKLLLMSIVCACLVFSL